jgi:hypothetical protein
VHLLASAGRLEKNSAASSEASCTTPFQLGTTKMSRGAQSIVKSAPTARRVRWHSTEAGCTRRSVSVRQGDRRHQLRAATRQVARGARAPTQIAPTPMHRRTLLPRVRTVDSTLARYQAAVAGVLPIEFGRMWGTDRSGWESGELLRIKTRAKQNEQSRRSGAGIDGAPRATGRGVRGAKPLGRYWCRGLESNQ